MLKELCIHEYSMVAVNGDVFVGEYSASFTVGVNVLCGFKFFFFWKTLVSN